MVATCNEANSPSQLEAQKLDEHFSHNLDPESERTVSIVVFTVVGVFLMLF